MNPLVHLGFVLVLAAQPAERSVVPSGEVPLARLVDLAAERVGASIEYDASALRGDVTLRLEGGMTDDELWSLSNDLLAARGFTTIRRQGRSPVIGIVKASEAAELVARDVELASVREPLPGFVSVGLSLRHVEPAEFVRQVESVLTPSVGEIGVSRVPGEVRISDLTPVVKRVVSIAAVIDRPEAVTGIEFLAVESLAPSELMRLVSTITSRGNASGMGAEDLGGTLYKGPDGQSVIVLGTAEERAELRTLVSKLDANARRETRLYAPENFGLRAVAELVRSSLGTGGGGLDIVEDELTATLQVTATPAQHGRIAELLRRLESVPAEARRPLRAFPVRNRDVEEIASLIRELIEAGVLETGGGNEAGSFVGESFRSSGEREGVAQGLPRITTDGERREERIRIAVDSATSRLLAIGEPRDLDRIASLVEELDVRQPQVMLEVMMVSLSDGQSRDFGIELQRLLDDAGTIVGLTSLFGISDLGLSGDGSNVLGSGSGGTAVVLDPGDFSVVIRALENISDGRSLSIPRVLVNNNESGTINSTVEEPFISTNASDTVATTSFGGSSAAGTQVSVTPQIAEGDHIVLQYSISLSSFVGESADPALPPPRQQNNISSRATIPDGYTIVVGGIEIQSDAEAETRVPVLGQIPGIGELFKSRSRSNSRSRFYAFIKPTVLRHSSFADLKHISAPIRESMEIDDDYPVLLPRVIR